jgi:hypothetical protein
MAQLSICRRCDLPVYTDHDDRDYVVVEIDNDRRETTMHADCYEQEMAEAATAAQPKAS